MADRTTKPIDQVKVGDRVLATDPVTGKMSGRPVTAVLIHHDNDLVDLIVKDPSGRTTVLHTTMSHPVWDKNRRAFVETGRLSPGDVLQDLHTRLTVVATVPLIGGQNMYDLSVSAVHTFHVESGSASVLVHNCPDGAADSTEGSPEAAGWSPDTGGKLPEAWGKGRANKKGVGFRWQDPKNQGNGVRIDEGNPNSSFPSQQVDHVIVRVNGRVIGRDGQPISGTINDDPTNAHIPLSEWQTWSTWDSP
jgi:hypothetical protein